MEQLRATRHTWAVVRKWMRSADSKLLMSTAVGLHRLRCVELPSVLCSGYSSDESSNEFFLIHAFCSSRLDLQPDLHRRVYLQNLERLALDMPCRRYRRRAFTSSRGLLTRPEELPCPCIPDTSDPASDIPEPQTARLQKCILKSRHQPKPRTQPPKPYIQFYRHCPS